jgi:predicted metal-dependent hydrolase
LAVIVDSKLNIGDIDVEVVRKDIKHTYLRVHPPAGELRISAPRRMSSVALQAFTRSRLGWIQQQQAKIRSRVALTRHRNVEGESLDVWGMRASLKVSERTGSPLVELDGGRLHLRVGPGMDVQQREALVEAWYRQQLRAALPPLLARWEPLFGVKVRSITLRRMKTRWGSCSAQPRTIQVNTELAKKTTAVPRVRGRAELVHLLEHSHNARFKTLVDRFLPGWWATRKALNDQGHGHPNWNC